MNEFFIIVVDIGGTNFRVALVNEAGEILSKNTGLTLPHLGPQNTINHLRKTIRDTASAISSERLKGIAIGSAGPIDPERGVILTPPSLPTWHNVPLKAILEEEFPVPIWVESDADLAALGEHRFGAGQGFDRLIYITVSTGIGGGIIVNGQLLRGSEVSVAEIGHMVVDPQGPECNCGGRGHLEALASGTAIARMAIEGINQNNSNVSAQAFGGDLSKVTAEAVIKAANEGNAVATEVMRTAGVSLGLAIVSLIHIFDPEVVIIGGGVSNAGELILDPIREVIAERAMPDFKNRAKVVRSALGDNSGLFGAAAFALDKLKAE